MRLIAGVAMVALAGCASALDVGLMRNVVFLTNGRCTHTTELRMQLDNAFRMRGLPPEYQYVDVTSLPHDDLRRGYAMPTILVADRDLFGSPLPAPPFPEPT